MKRDRVTRAIGFRPTEPWGDDPKGNRWCAWAGPVFLSRLHRCRIRPEVQVLRGDASRWIYVGVSWLGLCLSVSWAPRKAAPDWRRELTFTTDGRQVWPFVEDENANITGYGHQDPVEFAAAINRYDAECNGEAYPLDEQWTSPYIDHRWAMPEFDEQHGDWRLRPVPSKATGAIPITTLWGQR